MIAAMNHALEEVGIRGECVSAKSHNHLSFYDVKLGKSLISRIESRARDIGTKIKSKTTPIVKVMPEKGIVRLQVATKDAESISLLGMLSKQKVPEGMRLPFLLGEDEEGGLIWMDMAEPSSPHLLVAGATGSGKSVLLHNLIANAVLLDANGIRSIETYLVDPKRVEFDAYSRMSGGVYAIEHDYLGALTILQAMIEEMDGRYERMQEVGVRDISEMKLPYRMVVIDEVGDLMLQDKKSGVFQELVVRLAQKGRAAGIHLVLATQRPSVDVLTGLIKANFPARIACRTASKKDSQVIMDTIGAESLLGGGDAILRNGKTDYVRFQVAYVDPNRTVHNDMVVRHRVTPK
jgi:S-DNA-T family DNA segregation ATPase FtsK/SpoIIIE